MCYACILYMRMLIRFVLNKVAEKKENKQKASDEEKEDVSNMEESAQQE